MTGVSSFELLCTTDNIKRGELCSSGKSEELYMDYGSVYLAWPASDKLSCVVCGGSFCALLNMNTS